VRTGLRWFVGMLLATGIGGAGQAMGQEAAWSDLTISFVYGGEKVPARAPLDMSKDSVCAKSSKNDEGLIVNPSNKGIQNVALWVDAKKSKITEKNIHPDLKKPSDGKIVLDNLECVFVPHIVIARPGQTIEVKNSDTTGHNANFNFLNNSAQNFVVPAGGSKDLKLEKDEPAPIPVQCNVHPWMEAKLIVVDHPYVGVSDADGKLTIKGLPAGTKLVFKVYHENSKKSIDEVTFGGKKEAWAKGNFEYTLKPGANDLGTVVIGADKFKNQ
jgi:plastocyanin